MDSTLELVFIECPFNRKGPYYAHSLRMLMLGEKDSSPQNANKLKNLLT